MPKPPGFFGDWSAAWRSGRFGDFPGGGARKPAQRWDLRSGILALLSEAPRSGYQIMQELQERSGGQWRATANVVYPTLQQLQDEGLLRAEESGTARVYQLTDAGRRYVAEHRAETEAPWQASGSAPDAELFELLGQIRHIGAALWQIASSGRAEQLAQARRILTDARRALDRLLSEDDASEPEE